MFLAKEIRRSREEKGMKTIDIANMMYVSEGLVRAWEKGRRLPQPDHLAQLEELFGTRGVLGRIREELINAAVPLEWFARWPEIEHQATSLWSFQTTVVPGLLQKEDYARSVLHAAHHIADTEEMVGARLERQRILAKEDPPMLVALITESVLRHNVGGAEVMRDQLAHLEEMAERDNVIVQVVPDSARACAGFTGPFAIASFDAGTEVAYVDDQLSGKVVEDPEDVARLRRMFDVFRADALSRRESLELIRRTRVERWQGK
ncbi:helix-turn-helix domain-containing protein [Actinomadura alba]|nr:helix-turn-helix transcriptional regulator [Actinomadura alba]